MCDSSISMKRLFNLNEGKKLRFECDAFDRCPTQTSPQLRIDLVLPIVEIIELGCLSHLHTGLNWIRQ